MATDWWVETGRRERDRSLAPDETGLRKLCNDKKGSLCLLLQFSWRSKNHTQFTVHLWKRTKKKKKLSDFRSIKSNEYLCYSETTLSSFPWKSNPAKSTIHVYYECYLKKIILIQMSFTFLSSPPSHQILYKVHFNWYCNSSAWKTINQTAHHLVPQTPKREKATKKLLV